MAALTEGVVVVSGGYSRRQLRKDVDQGITHNDMFTLTPESEYFVNVYSKAKRCCR